MSEDDPLIIRDNPNQGNNSNPDRDSEMIDLNDRDPKHITEEVVKIVFEDVLAEPPSTHSPDCLWKASYITFTESKNWIYGTLTLILGIPVSLIWGLLLGCLSFVHIWLIVPCLTITLAQLHCLFRPLLMFLRTYVKPIFETMAKGLRALKLLLRKEQ